MIRRLGLLLPAVLGLALLAASPDATVERLLRQGNEAFEGGEYQKGIELYERAEDRATDPGQVAYNKATAFYRLALHEREENVGEPARHFRDAEEHYRRGAEGADEPRRSRALFGLANSLVQGHGEESASLLKALQCYRACLDSPDRQVAEDARHNLELTKLLWVRVRAKEAASRRDEEGKNSQEGSNEKDPPRKDQNPEMGDGDPTEGKTGMTEIQQPIQPRPGDKLIETPETSPGSSNAPPVGDNDPLPPLTGKEAEEELKAAIKKINVDRNLQRHRSAILPKGTVKDW